jgi:hypothetical protein
VLSFVFDIEARVSARFFCDILVPLIDLIIVHVWNQILSAIHPANIVDAITSQSATSQLINHCF